MSFSFLITRPYGLFFAYCTAGCLGLKANIKSLRWQGGLSSTLDTTPKMTEVGVPA